jgi:cysteinyl-tRNA synthetase
MDLAFPHHENEIAQSEGANDCTFVNTWMHVGFVNIHTGFKIKDFHVLSIPGEYLED